MALEATSTAITVMLSACGISFVALFYLFQKHIAGQSLLVYEPRRRVPWGPAVVLLAMGMPLLGIIAYLTGNADLADSDPTPEKVSTETLLITGWGNFTFLVLFVFGMTAWLATFFRADAHDLGLPTSRQQLAKDIGIGIFATVAALLPIYTIQLTLSYALQSSTPHPLVQQLQENHSPAMLLLGFAMAVIAAPLFEEFTFRGLLQGWLERREDEVLAYDGTLRHPPAPTEKTEGTSLAPPKIPRPTCGWIPDLPHGWTPILISGAAFGLAHLGHGVAPISLVVFGIVLGYLYQRTHRLVPSITAHMLFNAYSMILLWLQL